MLLLLNAQSRLSMNDILKPTTWNGISKKPGTMKRLKGARLALAASAVLVSAPLRAEGPAFDCTKAAGEVEELICQDEGLAALDRKLDEVYKAAQEKARDDMPRYLRV